MAILTTYPTAGGRTIVSSVTILKLGCSEMGTVYLTVLNAVGFAMMMGEFMNIRLN
jgi:hypothetical protein